MGLEVSSALQNDSKPSSLICSCSLEQPDMHYQKTSLDQKSKQYPFDCIGKVIVFNPVRVNGSVQIKQELQATGFLIAQGVVMTSASCITSPEEIACRYPCKWIFFQIHDDSGQLKWYQAKIWVIHKAFLTKLQVNEYNEHDIALLILEHSSIKLTRKIKLNYTEKSEQNIRLVTCPSSYSELYKKVQIQDEQHVQLKAKQYFISHKYSCPPHFQQPPTGGFAGSPLIRQFTNQNGEKDYEVVGLLRKYQSLYWWVGVKVIFSRTSNQLINMCKVITNDNRTKNFEQFAADLSNFYHGIYVFECLKDQVDDINAINHKKLHQYFNKKK